MNVSITIPVDSEKSTIGEVFERVAGVDLGPVQNEILCASSRVQRARENRMKRLLSVLSSSAVAVTLIWLLAPRPAYAYLDPGSGSYLLQLALAALLGILLSIRLFWGRIRAFLRRPAGKEKDEEGPDDDG